MRTVKWNAFLSGLCATALALGVVAAGARADVTVEEGASILIFPRLVRIAGATGGDTVIQIANTGNSMVHAKCYYVDGTLYSTLTGAECGTVSATCKPSWQETDFYIWLTKQQPTHWVVGPGRPAWPFDPFGSNGAGFDPGFVPPFTGKQGELKCIEVSETGEPITGNHLKGEATIKYLNGQVAKYNAVGIKGNPDAQPSNPLLLDGATYDACPDTLHLNFLAEGSIDPVADTGLRNTNVLTLVPCSEDFENQKPYKSTVQFVIYNEYEERFSASTTVECYLSTDLDEIDSAATPINSVFNVAVLGSTGAYAVVTPVVMAQPDGTTDQQAVVGVLERFISHAAMVPTAGYIAQNLIDTGSLIPETPNSIRMAMP